MLSVMERVRVGILINDKTREILRLEALLTGKDMGEIVEELVAANLVSSAHLLEERRGQQKPPKGKKPRTGGDA